DEEETTPAAQDLQAGKEIITDRPALQQAKGKADGEPRIDARAGRCVAGTGQAGARQRRGLAGGDEEGCLSGAGSAEFGRRAAAADGDPGPGGTRFPEHS